MSSLCGLVINCIIAKRAATRIYLKKKKTEMRNNTPGGLRKIPEGTLQYGFSDILEIPGKNHKIPDVFTISKLVATIICKL